MAKEKKLNRLFFAVELSSLLKTQLLTFQDSFSELDAVAVPADNFHITLSFLGNVTERQLENLLDSIEPLPIPAFEVSTCDLIYWPKPAVMALSLNDANNQLLNCKNAIEKQLTQLNFFSFDKKDYLPHITLFRQVEPPVRENLSFNKDIKINRVSLILSHKTKYGIQYQSIESWPLQNPSIKQQLLGN